MMKNSRLRIYLTGVGGQGTLTATSLLARTAMDQGLEVTSGEIHGMAQRGGVVESTILIGGWKSPSIYWGEADVILGFEPMETLRGLPYLSQTGAVISATEFIPPPSVCAGKDSLPELQTIKDEVAKVAKKSWYIPTQTLGAQAGSSQSGNIAMLAALCATGLVPFGPEALKEGIKKYLPAKIVEINLKAADLGIAAI